MKWPEDFVNRVICSNCLKAMGEMPDESVNLIITSPPYNKGSADRKCSKSDSWSKANIDYGIFKDNLPEEEYQKWQKDIIKECLRVLRKEGSIFYNHKPRIVNHKVIFPHEWLLDFNIRQMIIWDRKNTPVLEPIRFMPTVEYIFWITKERKTPKFNPKAFQFKEVWRISPDSGNEHPAPFPLEIPKRCIIACSDEGDMVLDPFLGSGTSAVASKELGRNFIGIELNPTYCKIAEDRLRQEILPLFEKKREIKNE